MAHYLSRHAQIRAQQRGINSRDLQLLAQFSSLNSHHKGRELLTLGSAGSKELRAEGISPQRIDRLRRIAVVIGADRHTIVTALRPQGTKGRRYFQDT